MDDGREMCVVVLILIINGYYSGFIKFEIFLGERFLFYIVNQYMNNQFNLFVNDQVIIVNKMYLVVMINIGWYK